MLGRRGRIRALAGAAVLSAVVALLPAAPAPAAGVTTHAWMALDAVDRVQSPTLKALLKANLPYVRAGAHFPDSGYALSNTYGEEAHWQRFVDALTQRIRTRPGCPDLTAPTGPCAKVTAFLMGIAAHGMGDEVWDWLFEPNVADLGEYYVPDDLSAYANEGGAELQMDLVAVAWHGQPTSKLVDFPNKDDLLAAFTAAGFTGADLDQLNLGQVAMDVVHQAEAAWAPSHIAALAKAMPWTSHNMVTAPGGVTFAAKAIAGYWDQQWARLLGSPVATKVSVTYPAAGERRVPATGWARSHEPGSARGRGGARTRIAAALTYARPFSGAPAGQPVTSELPAGAMTLTERDSGDPVPIQGGYPKSVPYGPDAGEHLVDIQPQADLSPCTWYRVAVTPNLLDAAGQPVTATSWDFRTGTGPDGDRCDDDPYTADEKFARKVTADLFGRDATAAELKAVGSSFARGTTRQAYTAAKLASAEERTALARAGYHTYLDRDPDSSGLTYWATQLKTITLPELEARIAGTAEVFQRAGGTNLAYVQALYPLILGRSADAAGAQYWAGRLDEGASRTALARMLLTSREAAGKTVDATYHRFLGRNSDAAGRTYWTDLLMRGTDPRGLWKLIILSAEYDAKAQAA